MKRSISKILATGAAAMALTAPAAAQDIPEPPREFRAAWVATVANIDWPSTNSLSTAEQQAEVIAILDSAQAINLNAIIFQARPQADALYRSEIEPWSWYLTGEQGKAPEPYYDPLEFWVQESHKRGIELHVWFNPYRAHHPSMRGEISDQSVVKKRPDLVKYLEEGYWWMDPAEKDVQDWSIAVVMDVVARYDIDGVHFDDYFYPYASYNNNKDFPDEASWSRYREAGGTLSRGDFRRKAVDDFIERLYLEIKSAKPHVKFGISPFGIWRPGNPPSITGLDQYDSLYADAKLWLNKGWVDYYTPQLYWQIKRVGQSYPVLLQWWTEQNYEGRHMWPGLSITASGGDQNCLETMQRLETALAAARSQADGGASSDLAEAAAAAQRAVAERDLCRQHIREIINQILITRAIVGENPGNVLFSFRNIGMNRANIIEAFTSGMASLDGGIWARPALVPASPWLDEEAPAAPSINLIMDGDQAHLDISSASDDVFLWVIYSRGERAWSHRIVSAGESRHVVPAAGITEFAVQAIDRVGNASEKTVVRAR